MGQGGRGIGREQLAQAPCSLASDRPDLIIGLAGHRCFGYFFVKLQTINKYMPTFDIVSEVDRMEVKNAVDASLRELSTRFDFKGSSATIELDAKASAIKLRAEDASRLKGLREIVIGKLAKRNIDLRNVDQQAPAISPLGHATQDLLIKQGLDGEKAKEITKAVKAEGFKVQCALQDRQIRVTGKKRDDLQSVIGFLRGRDFEVALSFTNFRD
jgi:uncharacterized protein YajQ (UPF0234 family)